MRGFPAGEHCVLFGSRFLTSLRDYNSRVMSFLRFLMLLSLVAWIGGLMFFAFVLAPTVFAPGVLPNTHLAGNIVGRSLSKLHWIAIFSGMCFWAVPCFTAVSPT